ncbi:hypothetical protein [Pseudogemmobacter faecipullorum]|uniref:Uncharacterized protein n=1 Tax=Pseudogemmobacter faecipullorum TaxID=2755041 RepID=A0ABS8CQU8_9RHOB|nr:hypothetical protein [Pseudogemmobacter faecipullorum]MCB5411775.1 hypothetical protein [Pseudogemmobacter faecipullorum]
MIHIEPSATAVNASAISYRNVLAEGTLLWTNQTADGFAANALGPQTYDAWVPSALPAAISSLLPEPVECDCAAIIAHTLGSAGATIMIQASATGSSWVTLSTLTPEDDRDIFVLFSAEQAYPRWRILITGTTPPSIGIAWIGPRMLIPGGVQAGYVPLNMALDVELSPSITVKGQYVGAYTKRTGGGTSIPLATQDREWLRYDAPEFIAHYNAGKPFLWMSCPDELPEDAHYCWRDGNTLAASFGAGARRGDLTMQVSAYVS